MNLSCRLEPIHARDFIRYRPSGTDKTKFRDPSRRWLECPLGVAWGYRANDPEPSLTVEGSDRRMQRLQCSTILAHDDRDRRSNQPRHVCSHSPNTHRGYRGLSRLRGCRLAAIARVQRTFGAPSAKSGWHRRGAHRQLRIRCGPSELSERSPAHSASLVVGKIIGEVGIAADDECPLMALGSVLECPLRSPDGAKRNPGRPCSRTVVPGLRCAPSELRVSLFT